MLLGWRKTVSKLFIIPQRVVLAIMGFLSTTIAYTLRTCLSLAITDMAVKHTTNSSEIECLVDPPSNSTTEPDTDKYDWSEELQGVILSSFYFGYVITHIPGGVLASRFGGKVTLITGMLVSTLFTLLTPICLQSGGAAALIAVRIIVGLGEGALFPSSTAMLASWTPLVERSIIGTLVFSGGPIGSIIGTAVSGGLISAYGWPSVFYFFGSAALIWTFIFFLICYSNPESHPFISDKEKEYLKKELGELKRDKNLPSTPWKAILTSAPVWALIAAQTGHNWGFFIMVSDLPKFMSDVLRFSIKENGLYSALPYACMWIVGIANGFFSDYLIKNNYVSISNVRKYFTLICSFGPGIFLVAASYAGCERITAVILFTVGMGLMGTFYAGHKVNSLDLSPNYAGVLMALTNGIGGVTGIIAPYIVGVLTPNTLISEWRIVFWTTFVVFGIAAIIFFIWSSGEVQQWNTPGKIIENGQIDQNDKNDNNLKTYVNTISQNNEEKIK